MVEVVTFDVRTQNYTMSGVHDEGDKMGDDAIRVLSADGLEVIIDLTVLYKVIPTEAPRILKEIGTDYRNTIVRPICRLEYGTMQFIMMQLRFIQPSVTNFRHGFLQQ